MTIFRHEKGVSSRNAEDARVIVAGLVCSVLIFSMFSACSEAPAIPVTSIDLVQVSE